MRQELLHYGHTLRESQLSTALSGSVRGPLCLPASRGTTWCNWSGDLSWTNYPSDRPWLQPILVDRWPSCSTRRQYRHRLLRSLALLWTSPSVQAVWMFILAPAADDPRDTTPVLSGINIKTGETWPSCYTQAHISSLPISPEPDRCPATNQEYPTIQSETLIKDHRGPINIISADGSRDLVPIATCSGHLASPDNRDTGAFPYPLHLDCLIQIQ